MSRMFLEHANVTVADPPTSAALLCRLFDWTVRWQGDSMGVGSSVHVGDEHSYIALYSQPGVKPLEVDTYSTNGQLNHLGIVVDDIDAIEERVTKEGLIITSHQEYEPGKRFYFDTPDGVEIEVVSYR